MNYKIVFLLFKLIRRYTDIIYILETIIDNDFEVPKYEKKIITAKLKALMRDAPLIEQASLPFLNKPIYTKITKKEIMEMLENADEESI